MTPDEDVLCADGCGRVATDERLDDFTSDGTPIVGLVCVQHADPLSAQMRASVDSAIASVTASRAVDPRWVLDMFVPGRAAPQGSKKHVGGGIMVESSKAVAPWRTVVAWHAAQVFTGAPLDGPMRVQLEFVMPRPAGCPKRSTPPAIKRPDADKLARAVFDALSGVVWRDDSQAVDLHVVKRLAELNEQPGARIRVGAA